MDEILITILLSAAVIILIVLAFKAGRASGRRAEERNWLDNRLEPLIKDRIKRSRAVLGGQFSEQLAPFLPDFPFNPNECRFIGKPVDFIVFKGMDAGKMDELVLVEVKSGKNRALSNIERKLRDAVAEGRVSWLQYNVPADVTSEKNSEGS